MAGYLTTHVLDTARGGPAQGVDVVLWRLSDGGRDEVARAVTNADGRTDAPLLPEHSFETGHYEIVFHCGGYLDRVEAPGAQPRFLSDVPVRFAMAEDAHYHVPLLLSPHGYSTYRGS